eukprot:990969-Amphidinium_carterae.1
MKRAVHQHSWQLQRHTGFTFHWNWVLRTKEAGLQKLLVGLLSLAVPFFTSCMDLQQVRQDEADTRTASQFRINTDASHKKQQRDDATARARRLKAQWRVCLSVSVSVSTHKHCARSQSKRLARRTASPRSAAMERSHGANANTSG